MKIILDELFNIIKKQTGLAELPMNPGASGQAIADLESTIQMKLPEDYKDCLKYFNGQTDYYTLLFPPGQLVFLRTEQISEEYHMMLENIDLTFYNEFEDQDRIRSISYHEKRIPIAYYESGFQYIFLDLVPGPKGIPGQLIFNINEAEFVVIASSVQELFSFYLESLKNEAFIIKKQPPEMGEGYWFVDVNNNHVEIEQFLEVKE